MRINGNLNILKKKNSAGHDITCFILLVTGDRNKWFIKSAQGDDIWHMKETEISPNQCVVG